jgi:leader peptidase (prepilin peptidase)/N-methyltransferase
VEVAAVGVIGLAIGSFLTVVAHRVPVGLSIVAPGSHCPTCTSAIRPVDNVPVVSYLLRRGRCRSCAARIPLRYPLTELATGGWPEDPPF